MSIYSFLAKRSFTNKLHHNRYWGRLLKFILDLDSDDLDETWEELNRFEVNYSENFTYVLNKNTCKVNFKKYYDEKYKDIISFIHLNNHDSVFVELGSGWGRNLIKLSTVFPDMTLIGGELSSSGIKIANFFSRKFNLKLTSFQFNYLNHNSFVKKLNKINAPIILFSSFSIEQVPYLNKQFFLDILNLKNDIVAFHIEPVSFQVEGRDSPFLDYYNKHYNQNFYKILKELELEKLISIDSIKTSAFGHAENITGQESCIITWRKIESK
jgi:hypothetical protein